MSTPSPLQRNRKPHANGDGAADAGHALIFGGAGFIGTNLAHRLAIQGRRVLVFDDLSRPGVERNARWLAATHGHRVELRRADIRDADAVLDAMGHASAVYHFAAQVAVTTSLNDPRHDFEVNALGTLNILEAQRAQPTAPPLLYTSTNKVYGDLPGLRLRVDGDRYAPAADSALRRGVRETELDFHSPYGCSKGAADQYVLDYARTFGLPNVVFRMSCIYGPHQCGNADQGWLAHFADAALHRRPVTIYGDGRQVRDVLFVDDLLDAMTRALDRIADTRGQAFNVGGGPTRAVSLRDLCGTLEALTGRPMDLRFDDWRASDQRYYVSDLTKLSQTLGWKPSVSVREGVQRLLDWLGERDGTRPAGDAAEPGERRRRAAGTATAAAGTA